MMKFSIQWNIIKVCYYWSESNNSFSRKIEIKENYKQVIEEIQDFCLDCYFENERDGNKVYKKYIADILGVDEMKVKNIMRNVFKKIRVNADKLL
jgi:DNA-directed RNA polymerase specialized sigma subunit